MTLLIDAFTVLAVAAGLLFFVAGTAGAGTECGSQGIGLQRSAGHIGQGRAGERLLGQARQFGRQPLDQQAARRCQRGSGLRQLGVDRVEPLRLGLVFVGQQPVALAQRRLIARHPARVRRIRERPAVALTVDRYDDDWTRLAWVQVLGEAAIRDMTDAALAALTARYPVYRDMPPRGPLIEIAPTRLLWWRATTDPC